MIGDSPGSDNSLVDNLSATRLREPTNVAPSATRTRFPHSTIFARSLRNGATKSACSARSTKPAWLRSSCAAWTGEKGIYAKLFDTHTTMRLDSNWLFFNVEGLSSDPKLETAMSMLIANAVASRAGGKTGQPSITVLDECWFLLDSPTLAPEVVQLFRTARKRNASVWGISQTVEDFVGTEFQPREHGPGILKNASIKIIGQQPGDMSPLVNHLFLNPVALNEVKRFSAPRQRGEC